MTHPGREALEALRSVRDFHRQCALLLKTADDVAGNEFGWEKLLGNQALIETSYSLDLHAKWMPDVLFRWWRVKELEHTAAFVSLLLCPRQDYADAPPFDEPLISAGYISFDHLPASFGHPWLARTAWWTDVPRDGRWSDWQPGENASPREVGTRVRVMARPLWPVDSTDALRANVLEPLRRLLQRDAEHAPEPPVVQVDPVPAE